MTVVAAAMIREEEAETSRRIVAEAQANVSYVRRRQGRPRRCFEIVKEGNDLRRRSFFRSVGQDRGTLDTNIPIVRIPGADWQDSLALACGVGPGLNYRLNTLHERLTELAFGLCLLEMVLEEATVVLRDVSAETIAC